MSAEDKKQALIAAIGDATVPAESQKTLKSKVDEFIDAFTKEAEAEKAAATNVLSRFKRHKIVTGVLTSIALYIMSICLGIAPTMPKSLMWVFNGVRSVFTAEKETAFTNPTGVNVIAVLEKGMVELKKKKEELKDEQLIKMGEAIKAVEDAISKLKTNPIEPKKVEDHLSSAASILASLGAEEAAGNLQKILSDMVGVMQTKKEEFNPNIHIPPYIPPK